jgi:hypothetical protein
MNFFPENEIAKSHSSVNEFFHKALWLKPPPGKRPFVVGWGARLPFLFGDNLTLLTLCGQKGFWVHTDLWHVHCSAVSEFN